MQLEARPCRAFRRTEKSWSETVCSVGGPCSNTGMDRNAETLLEQADAYAHLFDRVSAGDRFDGASSDGPIRLTSDQELLEAAGSVSRLIRLAEAERVKLAGEIARRSQSRDETSLARRMGAGTAANLVSQVTGVPRA
jgi:hypothetical protein